MTCLLRPDRGVKYCDGRVSVCLSARISQKWHVQTARNFLHMLPVIMARFSSDDSWWGHLSL